MTPKLGSLFGGLFTPGKTAKDKEEYQRALKQAQAEEQERQAADERKEGEPKCWIN
jgi:hypothetical protein